MESGNQVNRILSETIKNLKEKEKPRIFIVEASNTVNSGKNSHDKIDTPKKRGIFSFIR